MKRDYRELRGIINKFHDRFSEINYDSSLSSQQKANFMMIEFEKITKDWTTMIDYIDDFMENFDHNLYTNVNDIMNKWLEDGVFTDDFFEMLVKTYLSELQKYSDMGVIYPSQDIYSGIREIFHENIRNIRTRLYSHQDNVNIALLADTHYVIRSRYWATFPKTSYNISHILNIGAVSDLLDMGVAIGDNCDENTNRKHYMYQQQNDFSTAFQTALQCPSFLLKGNHDDNSGYSIEQNGKGYEFALNDDDFAKLYRQDVNLFGENRVNSKNYFSYLVPKTDVFVIGVDTYDTLDVDVLNEDGKIKYPRMTTSAITQEQFNFIYDQLRIAQKNGYHVLILTHAPLKGVFSSGGTKINHDLLIQLLKAFTIKGKGTLTGIVDDYNVLLNYDFSVPFELDDENIFTPDNGVLIGCVYGHEHRDAYVRNDGINHMIIVNSFGSNGPTTSPTYDDYYFTNIEDSWTVLSINTEQRTVESIKFGDRGTEINFNY